MKIRFGGRVQGRRGLRGELWARRRGWPGILLALGMLVGLTTGAGAAELPKPWITSWDQARATAVKENKPILAMFSATWCPPCQTMKKNVLAKAEVQEALKAWVPVYLDEADSRKLIAQYKVDAFPTFVILDAKGEEADRFTGGLPTEPFLGKLAAYQKYAAEVRRIDEAIAKTPKDAKLWKERGDLLVDNGNFKPAIEAYRKVQSLDAGGLGKTVAADVEYAEVLGAETNDYTAAEGKLEALEKAHPESPRAGDALFVRAIIALSTNRMKEGQARLEQYLKQYPKGRRAEMAERYLKELKRESS